MKFNLSIGLAAVVMLGAAGSAFAHHSFVSEYDPMKPKVIAGTVTKVQWTNPHARFYVDVKDAAGPVVTWEVEIASPNFLLRYGWKRDTLKPGDKISVDGFLARDGHPLMNAKTVKLADGRSVTAGSSSQGGTAPGL